MEQLFFCASLCTMLHPAEHHLICPLFKVPAFLHHHYLMSRIYMSRISTRLGLSEILFKQDAGRTSSKEPSSCRLPTSKLHTGDFDRTSGRLASFAFTHHSLCLATTGSSGFSCMFLSLDTEVYKTRSESWIACCHWRTTGRSASQRHRQHIEQTCTLTHVQSFPNPSRFTHLHTRKEARAHILGIILVILCTYLSVIYSPFLDSKKLSFCH